MLRITLIAVGGLLALAGPAAAAQPTPPRANSLLENTMISGLHAAPGTQVGSEG